MKDILKANNIAENWQQKPAEETDAIHEVVGEQLRNLSFDILGRKTDSRTVHGLLIINGKKVIKR